MKTTTLDTKVHDFLAQKRIAVAGVSRDNSHHPVGNLIYQSSVLANARQEASSTS